MEHIHGKTLAQWYQEFPLVENMVNLEEINWFNPNVKPTEKALPDVGLTMVDIEDAAARLKRFAPYLAAVFPETRKQMGILESPLVAAPDYQAALELHYQKSTIGQLWLKLDSHLPISGSIKARGGIYEVLKHAEELAIAAGKLSLLPFVATCSDRARSRCGAGSVQTSRTRHQRRAEPELPCGQRRSPGCLLAVQPCHRASGSAHLHCHPPGRKHCLHHRFVAWHG